MGLISPRLPPLDYDEWRAKPRIERIKPMAQDWAEGGFGTPDAVLVLYVVKIAFTPFGAAAVTADHVGHRHRSATSATGGPSRSSSRRSSSSPCSSRCSGWAAASGR